MKKEGNICTYQYELEHDLRRVYAEKKREYLNRYGRICRMALLTAVVNSPARRFYTSEERALRVINGMLQGNLYPKMKPLTREMYLEIFARVKAIMRRHPERNKTDIIQQVLLSPAPKFYMAPRAMEMKILNKSCKKRYGRKPSQGSEEPESGTEATRLP